jgi:hypothetical protein
MTGKTLKIGAEFRASAEVTKGSMITRSYSEDSNNLDQARVYFVDNVIINEGNSQFNFGCIHWKRTYYDLSRYTTAKVSFSLVPLKVQ